MKRRNHSSSPGYARYMLGIMLIGAIAMLLTTAYPTVRPVVLVITVLALALNGQRWHRHVQRKRRALQKHHLQI